MSEFIKATGQLLVIAKDAQDKRILSANEYRNTLLSTWKNQLASDMANGTILSQPKVLAFSASVVAASPEPTALTSEQRDTITLFSSTNQLIMIAVLSSSQMNTISPIRSCGFYYGASATTTPGTGTLGSVINNLNETKNSSIELTFQYTITFS